MTIELIPFHIRQDNLTANCDDATLAFLGGHFQFIHDELKDVWDAVFKGEDLTFICYEKTMSFAGWMKHIDGESLAHIVDAKGVMIRSEESKYDLLLEKLNSDLFSS